jgi:hypothetical protein
MKWFDKAMVLSLFAVVVPRVIDLFWWLRR